LGKSEARNPKLETNPNDQKSKFKTEDQPARPVWGIGILGFEIVSDFVLRISDF
jgi:hypothetical protein